MTSETQAVTLVGMDAHSNKIALGVTRWRHGTDPEVKKDIAFDNKLRSSKNVFKISTRSLPRREGLISDADIFFVFRVHANKHYVGLAKHFHRRIPHGNVILRVPDDDSFLIAPACQQGLEPDALVRFHPHRTLQRGQVTVSGLIAVIPHFNPVP